MMDTSFGNNNKIIVSMCRVFRHGVRGHGQSFIQQQHVVQLLSCSRCMGALTGGFKVGHLPASPFEGVRHHSGSSASNSNGGQAGGVPFGAGGGTSVDTTRSNTGRSHADHPGAFRGLASSASQHDRDWSPKGRGSPFEVMKKQQQVGC